MAKTIKARMLVAHVIAGIVYQCDDVIEAEASLINGLKKEGVLDTDPDAVKYCEQKLGKESIRHQSAEDKEKSAAIAKLEAELKELEIQAAEELKKDSTGKTAEPLKQQWEAKKKELDELQS